MARPKNVEKLEKISKYERRKLLEPLVMKLHTEGIKVPEIARTCKKVYGLQVNLQTFYYWIQQTKKDTPKKTKKTKKVKKS